MKEYNFTNSNDKAFLRLLGIREQDNCLPLEGDMLDILVKCEIFKSRSDAKRNGWEKVIPLGFSQYNNIGRFNKQINIYNEESYR